MKKKALIIGGSGGLSGRLATMAQAEYDVWVLTRGKRPLPDGVHPLTADRYYKCNIKRCSPACALVVCES